uniref:Uncharacterized protein n=1 Tax=Micrurus corallinus TaxID=54390 RepID=A0A2D4ETF4_MICCO
MDLLHKRIRDDMDRDQRYQEVAELLHKTRMAEVKLLETMKEELTEKMEETAGKKEQLMAQQDIAAALDANRKRFLNQEMNDAIELSVKLQEGDGYFERLRDLRTSKTQQGSESDREPRKMHSNTCLNESSGGDSSIHLSLDRGRQELELKEQEIMAEVRQLRKKLTSHARGKASLPPEAQ